MNNRQSFIILMAALAVATGASAETYVWTGALDSSWSVSQNWQPQGVPNASTAFARIDADPGKTSQVSLSDTSTSYSLGGLMIDADDSLSVGNGCVLTLFSTGGLTNNGALRVNAGGSYTYLRFNGSQTLFGAGELVLNDNSLNLVQLLGTQPVLTQAAGHTLRGAGQLLYNTGDLINEGTVLAQGVNALKIDPRNAFVNRGTLRAEGAGGLELDAAAYTNTGHTVEAGDGSKVVLKYGARLAGGTLMTEGTGRIWPQDGAYLQGGVRLAAGCVVTQASGAAVTVLDGLTNDGLWNVGSSDNYTYLTFSGTQTLGGGGALVLSDRIYNLVQTGSGNTLTHAAGHTIRGAGLLLYNAGNLINDGAVLAQGVNALKIDPLNVFVNRGTLRAEGAGGLILEAGVYTNAANTLTALDGSKIVLNAGARLVGGTLRTEGSSRVIPQEMSIFDGVTLDAGCVVTQANYVSVTVLDGLANDGAWNIGASINYTYLTFSGSQTLSGAGELVLSDSKFNLVQTGSGQTLTHASGHTIRGAGHLLYNAGNLVNEGVILAQGSNALQIDPLNVFVNLGTLRAEGAGGLILGSGVYTNTANTLTALDGSRIELNTSARLVGGTLRTEGSARVIPQELSIFDGVTLDAGCVVTQANAIVLTVTGGLENNGRWNIGAAGNYTYLKFDGSQTLGGTGELVLSDSKYNVVRCGAGGQTLTHAGGHTIRGCGYLLDNVGSLDNYGRILATGPARLVVNPSGAFRNLAGGVLGGTGVFEFPFNLGDNAGTLAPGLSAGTLTLIGNVSNAGSALLDLELGGVETNAFDRLVVQGALALGGSLRVTLLDGCVPAPGETFSVVLADGLSGVFVNAVPVLGGTAVAADLGGVRADVTYDCASIPRRVLLSNVEALGPGPLEIAAFDGTADGRSVTVESSASALYTLQRRTELVAGAWADVPGCINVSGTGGSLTLTDTNTPVPPTCFYRLLREP